MKSINVIAASIAAVLMVGCTSIHPIEDLKDSKMTVHVSVSETRAGYDSSMLPASFYLDVDQNGTSYDYSKVLMTRIGETNVYDSSEDMLWEGSEEDADIKALTQPYGVEELDVANSMTVGVNTNQTTAAAILQSDLLGATSSNDGEISVTSGVVSINFSHLYSKLDIIYNTSASLSNSNVIVNSITLKDVCVKGGYSYASMTFDKSVTPEYGNISMFHNSADKMFEAIFFPYVPTSAITAQVDATIDGIVRTYACKIEAPDNSGFASGKRYTLTVTLSDSKLQSVAATISEGWIVNGEAGAFFTE